MMVTMSFDAMSYTSNQGYLLLNNHQQLLGRSWFMNDVLGIRKPEAFDNALCFT